MSVGAAPLAILRGKTGAKKNFSRAQRALWRAAPKGAAGGKPRGHFFFCLIAKILQI